MSACRWFEDEGLLRRERGMSAEIQAHLENCADCRDAEAVYQRLQDRLTGLDRDIEPLTGWEQRVWGRIEADRESSNRRRPLRRLLPLSLAAAAAVLVAVLVREPAPQNLQVSVESTAGSLRRTTDGQPGDRLVLRGTTGGLAHAELRIYRQDTDLVLRCSTQPPCQRTRDEVTASFVLPTRGTYQPVLLLGSAPLPPPDRGTLDGDAGSALAAGATVRLGQAIRVH